MLKSHCFRFRSVSISNLIKYFGIFLIGFYTHAFVRSIFYGDELLFCSRSRTAILCCQQEKRYKPRTKFEVIRYEYFNSGYLFSNIEDDTKIGLLGYHKRDLKLKLGESLRRISENGNLKSPLKLKLFKHGYRRMEPGWGSDYLIDVQVTDAGNESTEFRVRFSELFCQPEVEVKEADADETVNFIVAIDDVVDSRFRKFLIAFSTAFLSAKEKVSLTVVTSADANGLIRLRILLDSVMTVYPAAVVRSVLVGNYGNFSRGASLHAATRHFPSHALLFFVDADVTVSRDFLYRCRMNAIKNKRVFYPIVFSQYKPEIVIKYSPQGKIRSLQDINKFTGHWVHYGYGMVCLYKEDYDTVGGFDLSIKGWGGEDVDLYQKHVLSHLEVFRAMDPGLIHRYHEKQCDRRVLSRGQWEACVGAKINAYGSKMQLAWKILTEEKQISHANFSISDD